MVYRLSYLWYTMIGTLITISVSLIATLVTSENVEKLDPMLLAPFLRRYLTNSNRSVVTEKLHQIEVS